MELRKGLEFSGQSIFFGCCIVREYLNSDSLVQMCIKRYEYFSESAFTEFPIDPVP